ncbi:hypothetical protein EAH_00065410, partial [Eimeria acervulina]
TIVSLRRSMYVAGGSCGNGVICVERWIRYFGGRDGWACACVQIDGILVCEEAENCSLLAVRFFGICWAGYVGVTMWFARECLTWQGTLVDQRGSMSAWEYVAGGSCDNAVICVERLVVLGVRGVMCNGGYSAKDGCSAFHGYGNGVVGSNCAASTNCVASALACAPKVSNVLGAGNAGSRSACTCFFHADLDHLQFLLVIRTGLAKGGLGRPTSEH